MFEIILRPYLKAIVADQMSDGETCLPYCLVPRGRDGERMEGKGNVVGDGCTSVYAVASMSSTATFVKLLPTYKPKTRP